MYAFLVFALLGQQEPIVQPERWEIKLPFEVGKTYNWSVAVDTTIQGSALTAEFKAVLSMKTKEEGGGLKGTMGWQELYVNGEPAGEDATATNAILNSRGMLINAESELGEDFRRMASVLFLIYPEAPIAPKDKWSYTYEAKKDSKNYKIKFDFEVMGIEKIKDQDTLKIFAKASEEGDTPMTSEGYFWVSKDGIPQKISINIKNWPVPQAGQPLDVSLVATYIAK
ncbi:MAG TPA: hypothetical protein VNK96_06120 [Fimbriimonadales bacterium]|nr:hypothetical protein [Fimbriimonadales bacterium]